MHLYEVGVYVRSVRNKYGVTYGIVAGNSGGRDVTTRMAVSGPRAQIRRSSTTSTANPGFHARPRAGLAPMAERETLLGWKAR